MKSLQLFAIILGAGIALSSCKSDGAQRADELCDCIKEAELLDNLAGEIIGMGEVNMDDEKEDELQSCALNVLIEMKGDVDQMKVDDQVDYSRDMIHALVDSDCYEKLAEKGLTIYSLEQGLDEILEDELDY